jgi:hypothetical protein
MLNVELLLAPSQSLATRPRPSRQCRQISGQSLAKADRYPQERADLAARWILGCLAIAQPTVTLASWVFRVSPAPIRAAMAKIEATTIPASPLADAWSLAGADERLQFVRDHLAEVWRLIDVATA